MADNINPVYHEFTLDAKRQSGVKILAVRGDTENVLVITLLSDGSGVEIPATAHVHFAVVRADGAEVYQSDTDNAGTTDPNPSVSFVAADGEVTVNLKNTSFAEGDNYAEIQIMDSDDTTHLITSAEFIIRGRRCHSTNNGMMSTTEYPILRTYINALKNMTASATTLVSSASATATLSLVNNVYNLALGLPRGKSAYDIAVEQGEFVGTEAEWAAAYQDAVDAANAAATLANTKAGLANDAATLANTKAGLADAAATLANEKAGLADTAAEAANTAAATANAAAEHAESAAGSIAQLYYPTGSSMGTITKGYTINLSGVSKQNSKRARTDIKSRIYGAAIRRLAVSLDLEGYEYAIALYGRPAQLDGTGWIGYQSNAAWLTGKTIISPTAINFALAFRHTVNGTEQAITDADVTAISESLVVYAATDMDLTEAGVPADAKATGDRLGTLEDASLHWESWSPTLYQKRITDDGGIYTAADNYQLHTYYYFGRYDNSAVRYAVKFESDTYQFRVASYGANGSFGTGGVGTDFNGFVNSWTTGTVVLPADCRRFACVFKKASGSQCQVDTDGAAIQAALSVQVATDTTLSIAGRAADAKAVRDFIAPELTASQKQDILDLVDAYYAIRENVVYRYVTTRNSFASKATTFDENNKLQLCCTAFTQLIWGGVDPSTFADPSTYDGTIVKAFDWGYFLKFLIRQRTDGLAVRENGVVTGEYGYRSTNGYEHGWSFNSLYNAKGTWPNSQQRRTALNASDIACELFNNGYEIPLRYADVGDMVFYEEIPSGMTEYYSNAFRRIDHASIVIGKRDGFLEVAEVTSINGGNPPVLKRSIFSEDDFLAAKSGYMASRIVMVARHPAAFGVAGNVPNKFATVSGRY